MTEKTYAVGYKKPPKETQFKKGQSGCPDGGHRQRRASRHAAQRREEEAKKKADKSIKNLIRNVATEVHQVRAAGGVIEMSTAEIIVRSVFARAMKPDASERQQQQALKLLNHVKLLDAPPDGPRPMVLVVNKIQSQEEWMQSTEGELLPRNPLHGIPGAESVLSLPKKRPTDTPD